MDCSVVIPAYNVEVFVARAIQSALDQTEKPADIIVVDDGSTDGTAAVVRSFGGIVRYCHQRNGGASAARNRGIREARGAFIALLDADDEWLPSHLAVAAQVFEKHPELAWYCAGNRVQYRDGRSRDRRAPPETLIDNCYLRDYFAAAAQGTSFHTSTMVVRRGVFEEAGLFDPQFRVGEDLDMFFRIALC
ncbi:MAG: glycosyltransferase family 2 protein, partial [Candidatus Atribacteria bacterium]|nr:glycosyltransferase family 2 protein [Candidatus Atribacteria bacterium]